MKGSKGFTLIEVIAVIAIISFLGSIAFMRFFQTNKNTKIQTCRTNVANINAQLEIYNIKNNHFPENLAEFLQSKEYFPGGKPKCPFKTPYIRKNQQVLFHNHE